MAAIVRTAHVRIALIGAAAVLGAGVAAAALAAPAQAAPIAVQQVPATGIASGGLGDWSIYSASIRVVTDGPGRIRVSAPAGAACGPAIYDKRVRLDYTNVATGRSGSATVRPCPGPFSGPLEVRLQPGAGQVIGAITIVSGGGPWQVPGVATFHVG